MITIYLIVSTCLFEEGIMSNIRSGQIDQTFTSLIFPHNIVTVCKTKTRLFREVTVSRTSNGLIVTVVGFSEKPTAFFGGAASFGFSSFASLKQKNK